MKTKGNIEWNRINSRLKEFFSTYKYYFLVLFLVVLLGFLTGIFTVNRYSGNIDVDNMVDKTLANFIQGDASNWTVFFNNILYGTISICIIVFFNFRPFMSIFSFIVVIYKSYVTAFMLMSFIILYSFAGAINAILIIFPSDLLCLIILCIFASLAIKKNFIIKKFGKSPRNCYCNIDYTRTYIFLWILYVVILLIKTLLLPVIRITIIL